jgi:hypothetical protein
LWKIVSLHENDLVEVHLRHVKRVRSWFNILEIKEHWQNAEQFVDYFPLLACNYNLRGQFKDMVKRHQQAGRQLLTLLNSKQFDEGLDQVRGKVFLLAKFSQNKDGRVEA